MMVKVVVCALTGLMLATMLLIFFIFFTLNTFDIRCIAKGGVPNHSFQSNVCFVPDKIIQMD